MKTQLTAILLFFNFSFVTFETNAQSVGINTTGAAPHSSALLDLNSNNKGFLITRVDTANIVSPAFGLMTLAPIDSCLYMYSGTNWKAIGGVGSNCACNTTSSTPITPIFPCGGTVIPIIDIISPATGKTWMDRNLGASQVATSSTDALAYGDLYQWGRCSDGHEKRTSGNTTNLSTTDNPGHARYIKVNGGTPWDWRSPGNNSLWQGVAGINNPCPTGYRIPTISEWYAEITSWASAGIAGAFSSPLKLTAGGGRGYYGVDQVGVLGSYWSSNTSGVETLHLWLDNTLASVVVPRMRVAGSSVRCIKN